MCQPMRAIQISKPGAAFELVTRERLHARRGEVLVRVQACGVCHSDSIAKDGLFPGIPYPIIPGHEVAGVDREGRRRRDGLVPVPSACRRRLVRGQLRALRALPSGRSHRLLPEHPHSGPQLRRRVAPKRWWCSRQWPRESSGRSLDRGCSAASVRRRDHLQLIAHVAERGRAILVAVLGLGGLGSPRRAIRGQDGLSHGGARLQRSADRSALRSSWVRTSTSTARSRIPRAELAKLGGARTILATCPIRRP